MFKVSLYKEEDYKLLEGWWNKQNFPPPLMAILPPTAVIIKTDDDQPIYAGFLYLCNAPAIAWVEYIVSNPDVAPQKKRGGMQTLIDALSMMAKRITNGKAAILFTSTDNPALVNSLKKSNFEVGDTNMVQLIKHI